MRTAESSTRFGAHLVLAPFRVLLEVLVTGRAEPAVPYTSAEPRRWVRALPRLGNVIGAGALLLLGVSDIVESAPPGTSGPALAVPLVLSVVLSAAWVAMSRWPFGMLRVSAAATVATAVAGHDYLANSVTSQAGIVFLACCYFTATRSGRDVVAGIWVLATAGRIGLAELVPEVSENAVGNGSLETLIALSIGATVRSRRRAQRDHAERAVAGERTRIARELHDVVAHHMSVIAIQAEAAPLRHPGDAGALAGEFAAIRRTSLAALGETRRILTVLHDPSPDGTAPQPGLDGIGGLVENTRAAGHAVTFTVTGTPRAGPAGVELSAYRIVQEALSNVVRHAPGADAEVSLGYEPGLLRVRVANGPGRSPRGLFAALSRGPRHGLAGMRERVAMLSGTLTAGPVAGGGFEVAAVLPMEET